MSDIPPEPGTIIEYLERDHRVVMQAIERFQLSGTDRWAELFHQLVDYLVRHEVAEEEVVFARLREVLASAGEVIDDCSAEQQKLALRLMEMERIPPRTPEFRQLLGHLRVDVFAHIAREEQVVIPFIRSARLHSDPELVRRYELARTLAPSHPEGAYDGKALASVEHGVSAFVHRLRSAVLAHPSIARR